VLAVDVELLTYRYVATAYNTRLEAEWPPHPARLFSALVATHFAEPEPRAEERAALEWLEGLGAPLIRAAVAAPREVVTVFVPVNDAGMTNVDAEAAACDEAAAAVEALREGDPKELQKARKELERAEKRLAAAIAKNTAVPKGGGNPATGAKVLPEHRVRQPRTFPSVTPYDPVVTFAWPAAEPSEGQRAALAALLQRVVRLGHSSSLVAASLQDTFDEDPSSKLLWRPSPSGEAILRGIQPGQLAALERSFALHRETEPRVMPARFERYSTRPLVGAVAVPRSVFSDDWLVLRRVGGPALPMTAAAGVARRLRRALMSFGGDPVPELLAGHRADRRPLERDHVAVVPLPFVAHQQASAARSSVSGTIQGVALVLPRAVDEDERRAIYRRVAAWEDEARLEDEDAPALPLKLGPLGVLELERVEWGAVPASLRSATWAAESRVWASATPLALDRYPGELRSRDPATLAAALGEAAEIIRRACERIGLPAPERVEVLPAAPLTGAAKAQAYPRYPEDESKQRRILTHARLIFDQPVGGPILLGAGRYLGLGLFRPEWNDG